MEKTRRVVPRTGVFGAMMWEPSLSDLFLAAVAGTAAAAAAAADLLDGLRQHAEREEHRQQGQRTFRSAGDEAAAVRQEVRVVRGVQRDKGEDRVDRQRDVADDRATRAFGTGHHTD